MRRAAIGILAAFALGAAAVASGLRYNGTPSFPPGFYLETGKVAHKGDLVFVSLPASPVLQMGKERGYLNIAYCNVQHLLKRLAAVQGDRVTIDSNGVSVNGARLANSTPLSSDAGGRPLKAFMLSDYILPPGEVLLMSEFNPASFDSRYFGPIDQAAIEAVVWPVLTF